MELLYVQEMYVPQSFPFIFHRPTCGLSFGFDAGQTDWDRVEAELGPLPGHDFGDVLLAILVSLQRRQARNLALAEETPETGEFAI